MQTDACSSSCAACRRRRRVRADAAICGGIAMRIDTEQLPQHLARELAAALRGLRRRAAARARSRRPHPRARAREHGYAERQGAHRRAGLRLGRARRSRREPVALRARRILELRIPTGKPGAEGARGAAALLRGACRADTVTLVHLPALDWRAQKARWFDALERAGVMVEARAVDAQARCRSGSPAACAQQSQSADAGDARIHRRPRRGQSARRVPGSAEARAAVSGRASSTLRAGARRGARRRALRRVRRSARRCSRATRSTSCACSTGWRAKASRRRSCCGRSPRRSAHRHASWPGVARGQADRAAACAKRASSGPRRDADGARMRSAAVAHAGRGGAARTRQRIDRMIKGLERGDVRGTSCCSLGIARSGSRRKPRTARRRSAARTAPQCRIGRHGHPDLHGRHRPPGARGGAHASRKADTATKNRALTAIAAAIERDVGAPARGQRARRRRRARASSTPRDRPPDADARRASTAMADGLGRSRRCPIRSARSPSSRTRPSGIQVGQMRVPLGVIGIIYESRPNVTADAAALCLKSGNAASCAAARRRSTPTRRSPPACTQGLKRARAAGDRGAGGRDDRPRRGRRAHHACSDYVDMIVPRGGKGLIERLMRESRIPMIKHLDGVCHVYIDDTRRPREGDPHRRQRQDAALGTCNTMETLLVARGDRGASAAAARAHLPRQGHRAARRRRRARARAADEGRDRGRLVHRVSRADPLGARGDGLDEAIEHIATYGSQHTDAIVTEDRRARGASCARSIRAR